MTCRSARGTRRTSSRIRLRGSPPSMGPGQKPVLVRRKGAPGEARLRAHRGSARGRGARTGPSGLREHRDGAHGVPGGAGTGRRYRTGRWWGRRARSLRRQPERQDHVQGGAPARDRSRTPVAPRVPVHARWGRGRGRMRVSASRTGRKEARAERALRRDLPQCD